ncbi:MAG: hypothetical protein ACLFMO_01745 [Eubacteriales bacterium]
MEALRQIIDSETLQKIIDIPDSFKNKKLELLILPVEDIYSGEVPTNKARGYLNKYENIELINEEKSAWKKAVQEKHGNS